MPKPDDVGVGTMVAILDEHYHTEWDRTDYPTVDNCPEFDALVDRYRDKFTRRLADSDRVFGAVYVPTGDIAEGIVSPREKNQMFSSKDAVVIVWIDGTTIQAAGQNKPALNAPLLVRFAARFGHQAVVHYHEQVPGLPTVPYAPPGTVRDNDRELTDAMRNGFNIEGHGCILPA